MPKAQVKKVIAKASEGMTFVKDGIETVRSKPWAEPVGTALGVTASICNGLGSFVPGLGIVGGAINMGSKILNPAPTLADIKRTEKEIIQQLEGQTGIIKDALEHKLEALREEMKRPQTEILEDFELVKREVQSSASAMTHHMQHINDELADMKNIISRTFQLVRDQRYRDGIEKIEGAYETFLAGLNNLEDTINVFKNYMVELQVHGYQSLKPPRIREYLRSILVTEDVAMAQQIFKYILVVRSMYLQVVCAFYIFQNDPDRVGSEFESFNRDFTELCDVFESLTGNEFKPEEPITEDLLEKCRSTKKEMPDITQVRHEPQSSSDTSSVEAFLNKIELGHLLDIFLGEEITMDVLKTFSDHDLKSIGITKFGPRRKILNALSTMCLDVGDSLNASSTSNPSSFMLCSTEAVSSPPSTTSKSHVSSSVTSYKATTQSKLTSSNESIVSSLSTKSSAEDLLKQEKDGDTGLMTAVVHKNFDQVKSILDAGRQLDVLKDVIDKTDLAGRSPLWVASSDGLNNICQLLLESKSDVNKSNKNGTSPLFIASQDGHPRVVQTLLENKASIDQPNNNGATPLFVACQKGQSTVVQLLIDNKASIHQPKNNGYTPIMIASRYGHYTVLETLLKNVQQEKRREIVNDRSNKYNHSPLISAIKLYGQLQTVKTLIEYNADPNLKGYEGKSPLEWAQEKDKQDIVAYLRTIVNDKPKFKSVFSFLKR